MNGDQNDQEDIVLDELEEEENENIEEFQM
jgi:hypothetical protein